MDCCQQGVKKELVIETDQEHIQDNDGFPQDTDPAFRSKKIDEENPNENIAVNQFEEMPNQENNNYEIEVADQNIKEIEQNEPNENIENNEANTDMNIPNTDNNIVQGTNEPEIKYDLNNYENNVIENVENVANQENNNMAQGELNIDQLLQNYNEQQQDQGNQNAQIEEDYNKYFEQNPTQQNTNDIDINQYFNDNNQNNQNNVNINLNSMLTFGENQADRNNLISSNNNNIQTSQEYNYDYNYNIPNA